MCAQPTTEADLLAQALRQAQSGQLAQAEADFRAILRANPASADAKFGLATVLAKHGRLAEAVPLLRETVQAQPQHLTAWINLGNALLQRGEYAGATQAYRAALALRADAFPAVYGLGCTLQYQGQPADAEHCFRTALRAQPNDPGLWMNIGTVLLQQRKLGEAAEAYREAVRIKPDLHPGWSALGQTLSELNRPRDAEQAFQQALAINPGNVEARIGLGDTLSGQQHDDAALACYLDAIALDPSSQSAHTKAESLLLRQAGAAGEPPLFERLLGNRIYAAPTDAVADALALLDAYRYPVAAVLEATRTFLREFDPARLYPGAWWQDGLSRLGGSAGHDKIFRGIASALYSWSPPSQEAMEAVAAFVGEAVLHSFGAGTGYWEWLLARHFGTRILAGDRVLRHRYVEMAIEDYATAPVSAGEVVFLAWIPRGVDAVMNLLQQIRPGQKLVIVGQGPDTAGKARICATDEVFRFLNNAFESAGTVQLGYYSYIRDDVRMYVR